MENPCILKNLSNIAKKVLTWSWGGMTDVSILKYISKVRWAHFFIFAFTWHRAWPTLSGAINSHSLLCRHRVPRAWQVDCHKRRKSITQIIKVARVNLKCRIHRSSVNSSFKTLSQKSLIRGLCHTHTHADELPSVALVFIRYCQGNWRRRNENRTNTQRVLSGCLSSSGVSRDEISREAQN